jgi:hypothetical protein
MPVIEDTKTMDMVGKVTLTHYWWECKVVQSIWKSIWKFLKKLKMKLPYDLALPFLGIYIHRNQNQYAIEITSPMFTVAQCTEVK